MRNTYVIPEPRVSEDFFLEEPLTVRVQSKVEL